MLIAIGGIEGSETRVDVLSGGGDATHPTTKNRSQHHPVDNEDKTTRLASLLLENEDEKDHLH